MPSIHWNDFLRQLDPIAHSLGYVFALDGRYTSPTAGSADATAFFDLATRFLMNCEHKQIRVAPERFVSVCFKFKELAVALDKPRLAILTLRTALGKLAPNKDYITPIHAHLFQVCILSQCYNAAIPALADEGFDLDPSVTAMTAKDLLLYSFYGGMIHAARRKYAAAQELFLIAITTPTSVLNAITLAAWKKFVLVSLIQCGSVPPLPKYTASLFTRSLKTDGAAYLDLADKYSGSTQDWLAAVAKHRQRISCDGNMGLVNIAARERTMRAVQKLTQTYVTLSLKNIAESVGLPSEHEAELLLLRMIETGDIFAQLDDSEAMVRFLEDPEDYSNARMTSQIDTQLHKSVEVVQRLQNMSNVVACDKVYLSKVHFKERITVSEDQGLELHTMEV